MTFNSFKLLLLIGLFVALCVKGGQICSAGGVMAMTRLGEPAIITPVEPLPMRTVEEDFRGVSPRPDLSNRLAPEKRVIKNPVKAAVRKSSPGQALPAENAKRTAKKG